MQGLRQSLLEEYHSLPRIAPGHRISQNYDSALGCHRFGGGAAGGGALCVEGKVGMRLCALG